MRVKMIVESVAAHTHYNKDPGISARCRMVPGVPIAVAALPGCTPVYCDIVVDFIGPMGSMREGQVFEAEYREGQ